MGRYTLILLSICATMSITFAEDDVLNIPNIDPLQQIGIQTYTQITTIDRIFIKVYLHTLHWDDGSLGISDGEAIQTVTQLNNYFTGSNIIFIPVPTVDHINNRMFYQWFPDASYPGQIMETNRQPDGLNIYIGPDYQSNQNIAKADSIPGNALIIGGRRDSWILRQTGVLAHEVGHCLGLWHTHHGTFPESGDTSQCPELVNGSNSDICGDYVIDTPADPNINFNVNAYCEWSGTLTDANGDTYQPPVHNLMSYSRPQCLQEFTENQIARMHAMILNSQILQEILLPTEISLANRPDNEESPTTLLSGTLNLENINEPEYDRTNIISGSTTDFIYTDVYNISTNDEIITGRKFFRWDSYDDYFMVKQGVLINSVRPELTAWYRNYFEVQITSNVIPIERIQIRDPWYVEPGTQNEQRDNYHYLSAESGNSCSYNVFLNQYSENTPAFYTIRTPKYYYYNNLIYKYTGVNSTSVEIVSQNENQSGFIDLDIVFHTATDALSAQYTPLDEYDAVDIYPNSCSISPGATIYLPLGSTLVLHGETNIIGTRDNPITLVGSGKIIDFDTDVEATRSGPPPMDTFS